MPDPPQFVSYTQTNGGPLPYSNNRSIARAAAFRRSSQHPVKSAVPSNAPSPTQEEISEPTVNTAGIGARGRGIAPNPGPNRSQPQDPRPTHSQPQAKGATTNGRPSSRAGTSHGRNEAPHMVNSKDPQNAGRSQSRLAPGGSANVGDESDPFYRQMANLRIGDRNGARRDIMDSSSGAVSPAKGHSVASTTSSNHQADYRQSAELVVGSYPGGTTGGGASRPISSSDNPPTASFMKPPSPVSRPTVLQTYEQSLPEERNQRRRSASNSRPPSRNGAPQQQSHIPRSQQLVQRPISQSIDRPVSSQGHAGIGANGRGRSPSMGGPIPDSSHWASSRQSRSPPSSHFGYVSGQSNGPGISHEQQSGFQRAVSRNSVGIALDSSGKVAVDSMAEQYLAMQRQQQRTSPPSQPHQQPSPPRLYQPQRQLDLPNAGAVEGRRSVLQQNYANHGPSPSPQPATYESLLAARRQSDDIGSQGPSRQQPPYAQPPPARSSVYAPMTSQSYAPGPSPSGQQPQLQASPPGHYSDGTGLQRGSMSVSSGPGSEYYPNAQRPAHHSYGSSQSSYGGPPGGGYGGRAVSPGPGMQGQVLHQMRRSPSPQPMALRQQDHRQDSVMAPPTRQYTEDGRAVLFYGTCIRLALSLPSLLIWGLCSPSFV